MRPAQWVKNIFVLAPVAFARGDVHLRHGDNRDLWHVGFAFLAFCLGASSIYLVNDLIDANRDRAHPTKRLRPIASGELAVPVAAAASLVLAACALALAWQAGGGKPGVIVVLGAYLVMNLAYGLLLKHLVMVDAFCIASGFLLRVKAGGLAAETYLSHWLMLCTLFLALFLALCKRRAEIDLLGEERGHHRANLREYTVGFIDQMVTLLAATTIVCYTMYTVAEDTSEKYPGNHLIYSVPFVVFGLSRYMFLVSTQRGGGSPTRVLLGGDAMFVINAVAWAVVVATAIF